MGGRHEKINPLKRKKKRSKTSIHRKTEGKEIIGVRLAIVNNLKVRLRVSSETGRMKKKIKEYILPLLPAIVLASHHFPDLSMMAKCSPFLNGSSLGSSAAPGSIIQFSTTERKPRKFIEE